MANNIIKRTWNQNRMVRIEALTGMAFEAENGGHTFQISGVDENGDAVPLTGTVTGVFLRPDQTDVALTGTASGGVVSVTLTAECYAVPGRFALTIYTTASGQKTAVYAAIGTVTNASSGTVSPAAAADVVDLVNRINTAVESIPASYTGLMAAIAPNYDNTKTYPKGYYVWYNGVLYRCRAGITTAESWTAAHWKKIDLANDLETQITDLKSAIKLEELGKYEFIDIIQGSYSNSSTDPDKWETNANRIRTAGMIPVYSGMVLSFTPGSNASYLLYGKFNIAKNLIADSQSDSQWVSTASDIIINWDGYIICVFKNGSAGTTAISPSDYDAKIVFHSITDGIFDNVDNKIAGLETTLDHITENNKNLLPVWNKTTSPANVAATYTAGKLKLYGTSNGGSVSYDYSACEPITLPAGTYTFSRGAASAQEILRKVTGTSTINVAVLQGSTNTATFTLSEETTLYLYVGLRNGALYDIEIPLQLEKGSSATYWVIPKLSSIDAIARENAEHKTRLSLEWTSGKAFIYNAGWSNNSGWSYADVILSQGEAIIVGIDVSTSVYPLSVWSDDGNSIIKTCFPVSDTAEYKTLTYVCSADKERVRINVQNTIKANVIAEKYNVGDLLNQSNIEAVKNAIPCFDVLYDSIIAIGDSLTQGSYTGSDLHTTQSYPAFLEKLMGNDVKNAGRAGWTTLQWWEGDSTSQKGFPYYSYGNYDAAVICLGTNSGLTDTLATDVDPYDDYHDYADTNTGAYCKIIEGMLAQNQKLIIFLCNIWAGGGTGGVSVTNDVIGKIAAKYGLPVIDLKSEFMTAYSAYHAVSGNIHLGRIGYAKMAGIIREKLNDYVMTNPTKFNYIPS